MIKNIDLKLSSEASGSNPAHSRYTYRSFSWLNDVSDTAMLVLILELHLNLGNSEDITASEASCCDLGGLQGSDYVLKHIIIQFTYYYCTPVCLSVYRFVSQMTRKTTE